ncbi:MAG: hypothetical protein K1X78_14085 [Verrucomicrobiaceae bacterium]|nr:hypothetical protein [Verrucomicrobiaceae bacterium]
MKSIRPVAARLLALALPLIGAASCSSTSEEMRAFVGQPSSVLLAQLGTPQLRAPDGHGGQIWSYIDETQGATPGMPGGAMPGAVGTLGSGSLTPAASSASQGFVSRREFFIDGSGVVTQCRGRGH